VNDIEASDTYVVLPAATAHGEMWRIVFRDAVHATANRGLYFRVA
jgi:hypothetical protein